MGLVRIFGFDLPLGGTRFRERLRGQLDARALALDERAGTDRADDQHEDQFGIPGSHLTQFGRLQSKGRLLQFPIAFERFDLTVMAFRFVTRLDFLGLPLRLFTADRLHLFRELSGIIQSTLKIAARFLCLDVFLVNGHEEVRVVQRPRNGLALVKIFERLVVLAEPSAAGSHQKVNVRRPSLEMEPAANVHGFVERGDRPRLDRRFPCTTDRD